MIAKTVPCVKKNKQQVNSGQKATRSISSKFTTNVYKIVTV